MVELENQISNNKQKIKKIKQSKESFEDEMQDYVNMSSYDFIKTHGQAINNKSNNRVIEDNSSSVNRENWELNNMKECFKELETNLLKQSLDYSRPHIKSNKTIDTNVFKGLKDFMNRLRNKIEDVPENNIKLNKKEILDLIFLKMESLMVSESTPESQISITKNNLIDSNIEDFISIYKNHQQSGKQLHFEQESNEYGLQKLGNDNSSDIKNHPQMSNFLKKNKRKLENKKEEVLNTNITSINVTQQNSSIKNNQTSYKKAKMLYKTDDSIYNKGLENVNDYSDHNHQNMKESHENVIKVEGLSFNAPNNISNRYLDLKNQSLSKKNSVLSINFVDSKKSLSNENIYSLRADEATTTNKTNISTKVKETKSKLLSSTKAIPNESQLEPNTNIKNIELNLLNSKSFIQSNQNFKQSNELFEEKKNKVPNNTKGNSLNSSIKRIKTRERSHPISTSSIPLK